MKYFCVLLIALGLWGGLAGFRTWQELKFVARSKANGVIIGTQWDPRGFARVDQIVKERESDAFRSRQRRGISLPFRWPGLASVQVSWMWLEILQGLHNPASYEGDFSWIFSKLNAVIQNSPPEERYFVTILAPFFFVIGHDHVGANLLVQEMLKRFPNSYNPWFWSGFHALDNLKDREMALDFFKHAESFPQAPEYLPNLILRLETGATALMTPQQKGQMLQKTLEPALLEKVRRAHPDWFDLN